jgi:hypothetical protein
VKTFQYDHLPIDDGGAGAKAASSTHFSYISQFIASRIIVLMPG